MKKSSIFLSLVVFLTAMLLSFISSSDDLGFSEVEEFNNLKNELSDAIESRNFKEAKDVVQSLFPLMKEEVKNSKKKLSKLQKQDLPKEDIQSFKERMERKNDLFESMKHIVDASPAAIRAKADEIVSMVTEFNELIDEA